MNNLGARRRIIGWGACVAAAAVVGCSLAPGSSGRRKEFAMKRIRRAEDRFHTRIGWLDSRHSFSFGGHYDSNHMGFRALRVINDDRVTPGAGFGRHGHRDMEIISVVLDGALAHKDSMGNGTTILPGEVQRMTAGTGVMHSEFNPQRDRGTRFLQIWIQPDREGLEPGYEQKRFEDDETWNKLRLVASRDGRQGSLTVHQDVELMLARLSPGASVTHRLLPGRGVWVQVAQGELDLGDTPLKEGDGAALEGDEDLTLTGRSEASVLIFDLA